MHKSHLEHFKKPDYRVRRKNDTEGDFKELLTAGYVALSALLGDYRVRILKWLCIFIRKHIKRDFLEIFNYCSNSNLGKHAGMLCNLKRGWKRSGKTPESGRLRVLFRPEHLIH